MYIENFSKYIELFPLLKTDSETIASCIYHGIILQYGTPKRIFSDISINTWASGDSPLAQLVKELDLYLCVIRIFSDISINTWASGDSPLAQLVKELDLYLCVIRRL